MRPDWYSISPNGYQAMKALENLISQSSLEPFLKELVKIRASQINECAYCIDMHTQDARALGETEQRIFLLPAWRETSFYSAHERATLAWYEALTLLSKTGAPDNVYAELEKVFKPEEIVEVTYVIVTINGWNRLAVGFRSDVGNYVSQKKTIQQNP